MNAYIEKLHTLAKRRHRLIVGLMSGTSLDGLDIALCRIKGSGIGTTLELLQFETKEYTQDFRNRVRQVFAKRTVDQQVLSGLHAHIGQTHGRLVNEALREWRLQPHGIDILASHGQTVYHAPTSLTGDNGYPNSTLQLGDGDHLAVTAGIITISDFRQKQLAMGGEGAPLAAYGDYLLFADTHETRILLNIGGIANFTLLPAIESNNRTCFATDVAPGNTLMNQYMLAHYEAEMDTDAQVASTGVINEQLLEALLSHAFFALPFPKTTGPELFNLQYLTRAQHASHTEGLLPPDVMATLVAFSASAITAAIRSAAHAYPNPHVYISGGGLRNPMLVDHLTNGLAGIPVAPFDRLGLLPDAKEAALFAVLANETVAGSAANMAAISDAPAVCMGKISFPR